MGKGFEKPTVDKYENLDLGERKPKSNLVAQQMQNRGDNLPDTELASIKKAGEKEILTPAELKKKALELKRCREDILYFCRKYFKVVSLKDGLITLNPYPKQQELLKFIQDNNRVIVTASRQVGKCLSANSMITIREVESGWIETVYVGEFFSKYGFSHFDCNDSSGKFIDSVDVGANRYQVLTDTVFEDIKAVHKTVEYDVWILETENHRLECANEHIVFDQDFNQTFVCNLNPGQTIWTEDGLEKVVRVERIDERGRENMYDLELSGSINHRYYTNGILSHNTTIYTVYLLWFAMYHPNKRVMICGNQLNIAIEIMDRIRLAYEYCPHSIKIGVTTYNKTCIEFENNSTIRCFATGSSGTRGFSANCVTGDTMVTIADDFDNVYHCPIEKVENLLDAENGRLRVLTENGFKEFAGIRKSQVDSIWHIEFDDGTHLDATSEHRLKKDDGEFIEVRYCRREYRLSTGKFIKNIFKQMRDVVVYDLLNVEGGSEYLTNGVTSHNCLVLDEAAFIPKHVADEFMASVFPVLSSSKDSKAIMVSTPNGTSNNLFYDIWQQATDPNVESTENWKPFRYLWYDVPGRDEEWKRQQIATIGMARWTQEFECEFRSSNDASLVPASAIEHYRMNLRNYPAPAQLNLSKNPDKEITANFWRAFDPTRVYAASGDISEGTDNDSSVIDVWDVTDVKRIALVARMSCSKATLVDFGYATYEMLRLYAFPPLIFENNGVGSGFVDIMMDTYMYPRDRMFYEQAISPTGKYGEITYGVKSKNRTKLDACMFLNELITTEEIEISIPDELLVNEMGTFVKKNTSNSITFKAKDKCHDDYMMTWVWGMYLLFPDTIAQHYSVVKAFKTKMDRVLPEKVAYMSPFDQSLIDETVNLPANKSIVSQLGNLEEHRVVKLDGKEREIPDDELFYGNRQWGHGSKREFFTVNQSFDFMNGCDWEEAEDAGYQILSEF